MCLISVPGARLQLFFDGICVIFFFVLIFFGTKRTRRLRILVTRLKILTLATDTRWRATRLIREYRAKEAHLATSSIGGEVDFRLMYI